MGCARTRRWVGTSWVEGMSRTVSVVIPTFDGAPFIERALRSVFAQTHVPGEIVVVDDCSSDGTLDVVSLLAKEAPTTVRCNRLRRNSGGPARPMNVGVGTATGNVIVILEQDDTMRPKRIERQLAAIVAHPGCSVVTGRFNLQGNPDGDMRPMWPVAQFDGVVDDLESKPELFILDSARVFRGLLSRQIGGSNSTLAFTKDTWNRLGRFAEGVRTCVDTDFMLKAALRGRIVLVNEVIVEYQWKASSLFRRDANRSFAEVASVRLKYAMMRQAWAGEELRSLQASARSEARAAFQRGDWRLLAKLAPSLLIRGGFAGALWTKIRGESA